MNINSFLTPLVYGYHMSNLYNIKTIIGQPDNLLQISAMTKLKTTILRNMLNQTIDNL